MPPWLKNALGEDLELSPWVMAARLLTAFGCACLIVVIYRIVRRRDRVAPGFPPTLVLLAILCAMLPQIIGENVARAFGLVGALSIVRFRTVVDDTYDIAFVIFAVLVGMAVGAGHFVTALVGISVTGAAALLLPPRRGIVTGSEITATLTLRVGTGRDPNEVVRPALDKQFARYEFLAGATGKQGAALDLTYQVHLRPGTTPTEILDALHRVDGIQSVELKCNG